MIWLFALGVTVWTVAWAQGPIVSTMSGDVQGRVMYDAQDRRYEEFLGIPYAQPPIGNFRFAKPEIPLPWSGVKDATDWGNACIQVIAPIHQIIGLSPESEDCLFVNVHVPDTIGSNLKPVMVFIYGGAWYVGTSDMYPGHNLALNGDVVVVSFNYRLGAFGFLSNEDEDAEGNWALWDGHMALQWVQANIERFGGDPDRVTLFGQSAGSASVSHHVNSPYSGPLFHRAIEMSGSSGAWFASTALGRESTEKMALPLLCPTHNDEAMMDCLRGKLATTIDIYSLLTPVILSGMMPNFVPVVDGDMVPIHPRDSIASGSTRNHDLMTGFTHHDGAGLIYLNPLGLGYGKLLNVANTATGLRAVLRLAMNVYDNAEEMVDELYKLYPLMDSSNTHERTVAASEMLTDFAFASQSYNEANQHARNAASTGKKTWFFEYQFRPTFLRYESWVNGSHIDDLYTVFGEPFLEPVRNIILREEWRAEDEEMTLKHQKYFANFAYTGDPNQGPHAVDAEWPQHDTSTKSYLLMGPHPEGREMAGETDRMNKFTYFTETWPNLIRPKSSRRTAIDDIGKDIETVRTALDAILGGIDMEEVVLDPITKFWIGLLTDIRKMV